MPTPAQTRDRIVADILIARINNPKTRSSELKAEALAKEFQIIYDQLDKSTKEPST